jgi:DNA invertase Pin-like site-specific DNA recombinase
VCLSAIQQTVDNRMKRAAIYLRVSTGEQSVENQCRELIEAAQRHGWNVVAEFSDAGISGTKGRDRRPGFDALCKAIVRREIDLVAAWSVDRLGRSLQHLVAFLGELHASGCDPYLHRQGLDTSTPAGRALFGVMSVFAEFERAMIAERTLAGLAGARANGKVLGRPKVAGEVEAAVLASLATGKGVVRTAREVGCGVGTVQRIRREAYHDHGSRGTHPTPTSGRNSAGHQPCLRQRISGMGSRA